MRGIDLRGRMAIVTGAGRGIGAAIVRGLDAAGARVALVARTESELRGVAATLGNDPVVVPADLGTVEGPACALSSERNWLPPSLHLNRRDLTRASSWV